MTKLPLYRPQLNRTLGAMHYTWLFFWTPLIALVSGRLFGALLEGTPALSGIWVTVWLLSMVVTIWISVMQLLDNLRFPHPIRALLAAAHAGALYMIFSS